MKKAIKKVASGLVRDAEKSWFAELSDKGRKMTNNYWLLTAWWHYCVTTEIVNFVNCTTVHCYAEQSYDGIEISWKI